MSCRDGLSRLAMCFRGRQRSSRSCLSDQPPVHPRSWFGVNMGIVLLLARIFLALVFGVAGFAKAARPASSRQTLIEFGVPEKLAIPIGWSLPFVEIFVALTL